MSSPDQAFTARLVSALQAFIGAGTWTDTRAILLDQPELLTAEAMRFVDGFIESQQQEEQLGAGLLESLREHQRILHAARLYGADVALAEFFLDREHPDPYWAACFGVAGLLGCDTWPEVRHWLTAYPALLDPGTDGVIESLSAAHHAPEPLPLRGVLAECQRFLARCRTDGVDAALALAEQDEFLLVPLDFGTVTAAFFALATSKDHALAARLIADNPDLVGDAFDAELDQTIGGLVSAGDSRFTGILVPVRFVLLRCQEVAPATALAESSDLRQQGPGDPVDTALAQLSAASGESEVQEILSRNPALLDQETDILLGKYLAVMRANNHDADAERLTALRLRLARYRQAGPAGNEAALAAARDAARAADDAEAAAVAAAAGYPAALREFIAAADWVTARAVLEAHPELLADDVLGLLDAESARHAGTRRGYELGAYRLLFRQAAAHGIGPAFEEMTRAGHASIEIRDRQAARAASAADDDGTLDDEVADCREQLRLSPWTTDLEGQHGAALSLSQAVFTRYLSRSRPADLAEARELLRSTLAAVPDGSPVRLPMISTLGLIEVERFKLSGRGDDIEEALRLLRQAEADDYGERAKHQVNLAVALLEKNDVYGEDGDLREAVALLDAAIASNALPAETLLDARHNLGTALIGRYQADGDPDDLDRAIELAEQALRVLAQRPARAAGEYSTLCSALRLRYYRFSRVNDLSRAVTAMSEAVSKCPGGDSLAMYLSNLGSVLVDQYQVSSAETDLEAAIAAHDRAIGLTGDTAASYAERLNSLGVALSVTYQRTGRAEDLAKVIETRQQVVATAAKAGRPPVPLHLDNLALSLHARYLLGGEGADLDEAVALSARAVALSPATAARRREYCDHLAGALADRWRAGRSADVAGQAVRAYRESVTGSAEPARATAGTAGVTGGSVAAARNWCRFAAERALRGETAAPAPAAQAAAVAPVPAESVPGEPAPAELWAEAAEAAAALVAGAAAALREQLLATEEETTLGTLQGAASEAAYVFARAGQLDLAVQTLEHGQSMMLAKTLTGKAAAAELARGGRADLADRYQALTGRLAALARAAAAPARTPTILDETRLARALDTARSDLDALVREIREQPGYERFLGGISFAEVRALAAESAIAYCAATVHGGLALLLAPGGPDVTPWFFDVSYDDLRTLLADTGPDGHTSGFLAGVLGDSAELAAALPSVLTVMRSAVGRPLAQALATRPGGECVIIPAGPMRLVPLHAALRGTDDEPCTPSAEITVSYAPSALSLRWAREKAKALGPAAVPAAHGFLGVADPTGRLRYAGLEVARAARVFEEGGSTVVTGPSVRSGQVLTALAGATYAHFACHGVYSAEDPGYSGIVLGGGDRLTVSDLRQSGALNARLIVASACQTAVTDVARLPDEAIGLPTALLEAGAAGVIGTLWPVPDLPAALLLSQYYDFLFPPAGGTAPAPAAALAAAQVWLAGLTAGELGRCLDDLLTAAAILPDQQAPALTALVAQAKASLAVGYEAAERPFADPACWAAFVLVGA